MLYHIIVSGFIQTKLLLIGYWVREWVVSERYILKNTESVVSGLIQTKVLLENIKFDYELYLNESERYILKNTKSVVSGLKQITALLVWHWVWERVVSEWYIIRIQRVLHLDWKHTKVILKNIEFKNGLYLDWYRLKRTIGVRHLLHIYLSAFSNIIIQLQ